MTTVIKVRGTKGSTQDVRVRNDADEVGHVLATADKSGQPFVVFTNADTGKKESFRPGLIASFQEE